MLQLFTSITIAIYIIIFIVSISVKKSFFILSILNLLSTLIIFGFWAYGYFNFGTLAFDLRETLIIALEILFLISSIWILSKPSARLTRWMPYFIFLVHLLALGALLLFLSLFKWSKLF